MAHRSVEKDSFRHQADNFAPGYLRPFGLGPHPYEIESDVKRRLLGVDEIHRHLGLTVYLEPESLHVLESARRAAHRFGDVLCNLKVRRRTEVNVVGDQEWSCSDRNCSTSRVDLRGTEIGIARRVLAELFAQPLELSTPNIRQVFSRWRRGGALVEVDRNLQLAPYFLAEPPRQSDAVLHSGSFQRNEGNDVGGADTRMLPGVLAEIDPLRRRLNASEGSLYGRLERRDERDHRSIV